MRYNKLVRDKVPELILKKEGKVPITHVAGIKEYHEKLRAKLEEEIEEFLKTESIETLVDVQEVLDAIITFKQFNRTKIRSVREEKKKERGLFTRRIILDEA